MKISTVTKYLVVVLEQLVTMSTMGKYLKAVTLKWEEKLKVWVTLTAGHAFTQIFTEVSSRYSLC